MDNKKYYWLKLENTFFNQKEIKKLRKIAGGDTLTIIYLKMQLLSLKNGGIIEFDDVENDMAEQLSYEIDEDIENIKLTIAFLLSNKLIETNDYSDLSMIKTKELIGVETDSAKRVRKHRSKKLLQCNTDETNCNIDIDIELDKEIELEKELNKELDIKKGYIKIIDPITNESIKRVKLTQEEYNKLYSKYGKKLEDMICKMDRYCISKGKSYKNYSMALHTWFNKEEQNENTKVRAGSFAELARNNKK